MVDMQDGQLTATSAEDYIIEEHHEPEKAVVTMVSPPIASPGQPVTLLGRNLSSVNTVGLYAMGAGYYTARPTATTDSSAKFQVPSNAFPGGKYPIYISVVSVDGGGLKPTNKTLEILKIG
jgi:hypothetical protein